MTSFEIARIIVGPTENKQELGITTATVASNVHNSGINKIESKEVSIVSEKVGEEIQETLVRFTSTRDHEVAALPVPNVDAKAESSENYIAADTIEEKNEPGSDHRNAKRKIFEASECTSETEDTQKLFYNWTAVPKLLCAATEDYASVNENENFTKGCHWSPDGTCLMVPADDNRIRIYELPHEFYNGKFPKEAPSRETKCALSVREGGLVYDCCWYPLMNSWEPVSCCFLSTSRDSPVHLWDAFTGQLRATYRPYNQVDEVEAAISVQFVDGGREIWCGFKGALRSFDTERPGRQKDTINLRKEFPNANGLVSCIRENAMMPGLIAFGTYSKCIGLYKDQPLCSLKTDSGVTQIEFSPCGTKLYTAVRRSNQFLCWDLRNPGLVLHSLENRLADTNQRIQFALTSDGSEIVSGGTDGFVKIWRPLGTLSDEEELSPSSKIRLSYDSINGVNIHKSLPILATSSGQRICDVCDEKNRDNSVRLWYFQNE